MTAETSVEMIDRAGSRLSARGAQLAVLALWLGHAATNLAWLKFDTRPPFYDSAGHAVATLNLLKLPFTTDLSTAINGLIRVNLYPPLVYWLAAPLAIIFWPSVDTLTAIETLFLGILIFSTYAIAHRFSSPSTGIVAAFIVSMYPIIYGLSRHYLLDVPLTAMTALSVWLLLRTEYFDDLSGSILFGVAAGLGMLTKWTFVIYVAGPVLVVVLGALRMLSRRILVNLVVAGVSGVVVMAPWYLSNVPELQYRAWLNDVLSVVEGDPTVGSLDSWLYYARGLVTDQILLPLAILWGLSMVILLIKRPNDRSTVIILAWTFVTYLVMTVFALKDPRFTMPYLPAAAITTALALACLRPRWLRIGLTTALAIYCLLEFAGLTFGLSNRLPMGALTARVVLLNDPKLPLYSENVHIASPARAQDWKVQDIIHDMHAPGPTDPPGAPRKLTVIPDIPYFEPNGFDYFAAAEGWQFRTYFVASSLPVPNARDLLLDSDYIVAKTGNQGPAHVQQDVQLWNRLLRDSSSDLGSRFFLVATYELPDGSTAELYRRKN